MAYVVKTEKGQGFGLADGRLADTVRAIVVWDTDNKIAWRGRTYWKGEEPRNSNAVAGKARKSFQSYYDRTGLRWEVEVERKKSVEKSEREAKRNADRALRDAAPDLLEALKIARRYVAKSDNDLALRTVDAAISKATGAA